MHPRTLEQKLGSRLPEECRIEVFLLLTQTQALVCFTGSPIGDLGAWALAGLVRHTPSGG